MNAVSLHTIIMCAWRRYKELFVVIVLLCQTTNQPVLAVHEICLKLPGFWIVKFVVDFAIFFTVTKVKSADTWRRLFMQAPWVIVCFLSTMFIHGVVALRPTYWKRKPKPLCTQNNKNVYIGMRTRCWRTLWQCYETEYLRASERARVPVK